MSLYLTSTASAWSIPIPNNSFEEAALLRLNMPSGYGTYTTSGTKAVFRWDDTVARTGKHSLYISNAGSQTALWRIEDSIPCIEGIPYKISIWVKTKDTVGFVGIGVRYKNEKKQWITGPIHGQQNAAGTNDWQQLVFETRPPVAGTLFDLFLMNTQGKGGEIWFDDLAVEEAFDTQLRKQLPVITERLNQVSEKKLGLNANGYIPSVMSEMKSLATALLKKINDTPANSSPGRHDIKELEASWQKLKEFDRTAERALSLQTISTQWSKMSGKKDFPYFLGWQDSMTRIWIKDLPISCTVKKSGSITAVKGETEALQIVIGAVKQDLKQVAISVGDLIGPGGKIVSSQIEIHPVGYVYIKRPSGAEYLPLEQDYKGWWPDILLDNFAFDVAQGDTQPVWISVNVPRGIKAGMYKGTVLVKSVNAPSYKLALNLKVHNIELPKTWHFRNIMSFHDHWAKQLYEDKWTPEMRAKYIDFLLARRINLASMYGDTDFTWEEIMKGVKAGQNTILIYTIPANAGLKEEPKGPPWISDKVLSDARKTLDVWVPKLKDKGLLDISLFYGFDEVTLDWVEAARNVFTKIKKDYPGLHTISTLQDSSYGINTNLSGVVDNFMPLMKSYDAIQAETARVKGSKVWWYETTWNIEQSLSRSRQIPVETYLAKADGFLIWCINRWVGGDKPGLPKSSWKSNTKPIENKIFSDWDPYLDGESPNSTAMYIYPGINGPLSSIRLETFRDGIEKYDLFSVTTKNLGKLNKINSNQTKMLRPQKANESWLIISDNDGSKKARSPIENSAANRHL